jgi:hypothetical protein
LHKGTVQLHALATKVPQADISTGFHPPAHRSMENCTLHL